MSEWNTTKLIAAASFGVLAIVFALIGSTINVITGVTFAGGIISFLGIAIIVLCCLIVRKFGAATIMGIVTSILATPLPIGGPPGFLPSKLIIFISVGLVADITYALLRKYERLSAIITGLVVGPTVGILTVGLALLFSLPGAETYVKFVFRPVIVLVSFPVCAFLGYVAWLIYNKLKNTAIVRRIQA